MQDTLLSQIRERIVVCAEGRMVAYRTTFFIRTVPLQLLCKEAGNL